MENGFPITVTAFYKFVELAESRLPALIAAFEEKAKTLGIRGLILVAKEGVNGTVAGPHAAIISFKEFLHSHSELSDLVFKDSPAQQIPFRRLAIQLRDEIVTLKAGIGIPNITASNRLDPAAWNRMLQERRDQVALIDVRNDYEVEIGRFRGAIDPKTKIFSEFPEFVKNAGIPKETPIMMYCTGGIRCEKAIEEMYSQGYQEVYQLDGGILRYLEESPDAEFEGECFVFDHRVSVDQRLQPTTKYHLCPHCGNPGTLVIDCTRCDNLAEICHKCAEKAELNSCSKNCAYHLEKRAGQGRQDRAA